MGFIKRTLVETAFSKKTAYLTGNPPTYTSALWDKLVFNKMKQALGGNVRHMLTGSAPIDNKVFDFMRVMACSPM